MSYKAQLSDQDIVFDVEEHETVLEAALRQGTWITLWMSQWGLWLMQSQDSFG